VGRTEKLKESDFSVILLFEKDYDYLSFTGIPKTSYDHLKIEITMGVSLLKKLILGSVIFFHGNMLTNKKNH
jgi:hypothetical protein